MWRKNMMMFYMQHGLIGAVFGGSIGSDRIADCIHAYQFVLRHEF